MSHIVKIISERHREKAISFRRDFQLIGDYPGNGFSFPCKKNGELIVDEFYEHWKPNYDYCINHPQKYKDCGVVDESWWYTEPAHALCSCGEEIILDGDTQCPDCGQWYNGSGQSLKDPSEWYEDEDWGDEYACL